MPSWLSRLESGGITAAGRRPDESSQQTLPAGTGTRDEAAAPSGDIIAQSAGQWSPPAVSIAQEAIAANGVASIARITTNPTDFAFHVIRIRALS